MRRVFITMHLKNILLLITAFIAFIVIASVLIVGVGDNKSLNKNKDTVNKPEEYENLIKNGELPKISKVKVYISKENAIKELSLEEYVTGVVAAEMPAEFADLVGVSKKNWYKKSKKEYLTKEERDEVKNLFGNNLECSFAKDKDGYYCHTHRARSKSYNKIKDIPKSEVEFIGSTG